MAIATRPAPHPMSSSVPSPRNGPDTVDWVATDPRVRRSKAAVLEAARDLLVEGGPSAVTIEALIERSGVARSTIYRHWEGRDQILVDVVETFAPKFEPPPQDLDFADAVRFIAHSARDALVHQRWGQLFPSLLLLLLHEDGLFHLRSGLHHAQMDILHDVLQRRSPTAAVDRPIAADEAAAALLGPLMFAMFSGAMPLDDDYCDAVADRFIRSLEESR